MKRENKKDLSLKEKKLSPGFIEIETATFCNRQCPWCPNSVYTRGRKQRYIDSKLFNKIIKELSALSWRGEIALHNYNEPLLDKYLFSRIQKIKRELPGAWIVIFTNGDYLDKRMWKRLVTSGVRTIYFSVHAALEEEHHEKVLERLNDRIGMRGKMVDISDKLGKKFLLKYKKTKLIYYLPHRAMLTSRGGIVGKYIKAQNRKGFCYLPFFSCAIDYKGNMKLCCEVYPEHESHKKNGIVGNLGKNDFTNLWFSEPLNLLRKDLLRGRKQNIICSYCPGYTFNIDTIRMRRWRRFLSCS